MLDLNLNFQTENLRGLEEKRQTSRYYQFSKIKKGEISQLDLLIGEKRSVKRREGSRQEDRSSS